MTPIIKYIYLLSATIVFTLISVFYLRVYPIFYHPKEYPTYVHKTLYVDRNFNDEEFGMIASAAISWTESTNHIVEYDIVRLPTTEHINKFESIIITKVDPDYPDIMRADDYQESNTLGLYNNEDVPYIELVTTNMLNDAMLKSVTMHELGHSLGLNHDSSIDGIGTLMYPSIDFGSYSITNADLENFCKLYHCDAAKLKH